MPSEKKKTKNTEIARLHADLNMLIAKVLIVNCSTRARNIMTGSFASENASRSVQNSENNTTATRKTVASPPRMRVQAEWMRRGYVRPEIYEELRKRLDGNDATIETMQGLPRRGGSTPTRSLETTFPELFLRAYTKS
jgi:hypothetical protein